MPAVRTSLGPKLKRGVIVLGLAAGAVWFAFFDSHSLLHRIQYYAEHRELSAENARLQEEIERLEAATSQPLTDEVVEEIAREEYGMRRPGERVYPVEEVKR